MTSNLNGKVAVITGAARNMGRAFAVALAQQGCDIVVHFNSEASRADAEATAEQVQQTGSKVLLVKGDLSRPNAIRSLFAEAHNTFGHIDIVINNAGKILKRPIADCSEADYNQLFDINCKAAFFVMQEAARYLADNGRIINMGTSLLAAFTGNYSLYAGSKAALEHFTRALAKEIGPRGVTVNTVCPGPIDTPFLHGEEDEQTLAHLRAASVANRLGQVKDIVPLISFLASAESQWTTGQTLFVNGGFVTR